jgi:hypothetical protein
VVHANAVFFHIVRIVMHFCMLYVALARFSISTRIYKPNKDNNNLCKAHFIFNSRIPQDNARSIMFDFSNVWIFFIAFQLYCKRAIYRVENMHKTFMALQFTCARLSKTMKIDCKKNSCG